MSEQPDGEDMSEQLDGNAVITVEVREEHIYGCDPESTVD